MKGKADLLAALAALPDAKFEHVATVCCDIAKRLPGEYDAVGASARTVLGIPEPAEKEVTP